MSGRSTLARLGGSLAAWVLPLGLLAAWEIAAQTGAIEARTLPAPSAVALAFRDSIENGTLFTHTWVSTERALKGLLIGGGIGLVLGVLTGAWSLAEKLLDSSVQMLRNVPHSPSSRW